MPHDWFQLNNQLHLSSIVGSNCTARRFIVRNAKTEYLKTDNISLDDK